jgi:ribosome-associated protein
VTTDPPPPARPGRPDDQGATGWLRVSSSCSIRLDELQWRFTTSGGPGGQHANKAATRAEVRFDIATSPSLEDYQRERLENRFGPVLTVVVDETRSQGRNRALAVERLRGRLAAALIPPRNRRATKPSKGSVERRLDAKRRRAQTKRQRRPGPDD